MILLEDHNKIISGKLLATPCSQRGADTGILDVLTEKFAKWALHPSSASERS